MHCLDIFGLQYENDIVILEIGTFKFFYLQNLTKKQKCLNLKQEMPYLGIFELKFYKAIVIFEFSIFEFVKLQTFVKK